MHGMGGMCGRGACMVRGSHAWHGGACVARGACMVKGGCAWQEATMCGEGCACVAKGGMHDKRWGVHAWYACPPYEIRLVNARAVCILLEYILVHLFNFEWQSQNQVAKIGILVLWRDRENL